MGISTIMEANNILLCASGIHKAAAIKATLDGPRTIDVPASVLTLHPNLMVMLDEEAAAYLEFED